MNFEENKLTDTSQFRCSLSSLLDFWVALEAFQVFFDFLPLTTLKKREGWKLQRSPNTQDSCRSRLSRENRKALKFCFGRAKLEHNSIILSQSKRNRSFSHDAWAGKTSTFRYFESGNTLQSPGPSAPTAIVLDRTKGLKDHFRSI